MLYRHPGMRGFGWQAPRYGYSSPWLRYQHFGGLGNPGYGFRHAPQFPTGAQAAQLAHQQRALAEIKEQLHKHPHLELDPMKKVEEELRRRRFSRAWWKR